MYYIIVSCTVIIKLTAVLPHYITFISLVPHPEQGSGDTQQISMVTTAKNVVTNQI